VTRGAILAAYPQLGYLADPSQPVREATEYEAAIYAARRSDPEWSWLWRLLAEGDAFAAGKQLPPESEPEPQPDGPEPAPDATAILNPGEALTALLPPQDAPTALLPAAQDEEEQA
jgi:hypothetical protein